MTHAGLERLVVIRFGWREYEEYSLSAGCDSSWDVRGSMGHLLWSSTRKMGQKGGVLLNE